MTQFKSRTERIEIVPLDAYDICWSLILAVVVVLGLGLMIVLCFSSP
jgi:hypothetical protein